MISPEEKKTKDLELINYLKSVIENKEVVEFEDIGFCYWNISDNYALLGDGHALRKNHQSFYECIMACDSSYLWWLVCDATQRLTLDKDGYFITPFGKRKCAVVGITSSVNALIDNNELEQARELYYLACETGLPRSIYVEKRL